MKAILKIKFKQIGPYKPEFIRNNSNTEYQMLLKSTEDLCKRMAEGLQKDYFKKAKLDTEITYEVIP